MPPQRCVATGCIASPGWPGCGEWWRHRSSSWRRPSESRPGGGASRRDRAGAARCRLDRRQRHRGPRGADPSGDHGQPPRPSSGWTTRRTPRWPRWARRSRPTPPTESTSSSPPCSRRTGSGCGCGNTGWGRRSPVAPVRPPPLPGALPGGRWSPGHRRTSRWRLIVDLDGNQAWIEGPAEVVFEGSLA